MRLRSATRADLPRIREVRHGTAENRLSDPNGVTVAEVEWYMDNAIFLVTEDEVALQGSGVPVSEYLRHFFCGEAC